MQRALAPLLFADADPAAAKARRTSIVAPAVRSEEAQRKVARRTTDDGTPLHSFRTLLRDLATLTRNNMRLGEARFQQLATPTPLQSQVFPLLGVRPSAPSPISPAVQRFLRLIELGFSRTRTSRHSLMNAYYAEFEPVPAEKARPHQQHAGVDFLYVPKGQLALCVAGKDYLLDVGDSVYFRSAQPHSYRRVGDKRCSVIVVAVP